MNKDNKDKKSENGLLSGFFLTLGIVVGILISIVMFPEEITFIAVYAEYLPFFR